MSNRSLVIDVVNEVPQGDLNNWNVLGNAGTFIREIKTPDLAKDADTASIVSGIPTAFARVDLFKQAFNSKIGSETTSSNRNLYNYYDELVDEWRGFVAAIALDYSNIRARRIDMVYSDGKDTGTTANIYEPKGAFGNMLLERRERWCEQGREENDKGTPYINIIKYDGRVVGATAPETLLFTSPGYTVSPSEDRPWVSRKGKFTNPLKGSVSEAQLQTLYAYADHLLKNLNELETYFPHKLGIDLNPVRTNLERWKDEMETYASSHTYKTGGGAIPPVSFEMGGPFKELFSHQDKLYGVEGTFSETAGLNGAKAIDPRHLLLPPEAKIARIHLSSEYMRNPEKIRTLPVYLLRADIKNEKDEKAFFALPLSAQGLNVFGKAIGALVGIGNSASGELNGSLSAVYDPDAETDNLEVEFQITTIEGITRRYAQQYTVGRDILFSDKDILLWPNFISKQWNKYYLYSELPHNSRGQGYRAYPFVGDISDPYFRILTNDDESPLLLAGNGVITADKNKVDARILVGINERLTNEYKYEIYSSDKPFKGIALQAPGGEEGGYLIINYSNDPTSTLPRDMLSSSKALGEVTVGIDFGSTNTSVAYSDMDGVPEGFSFTNQRVSLLDREEKGSKAGLQPNRVLFFQAPERPVQSNNVHSILTIHPENRLQVNGNDEDIITRLSREVEGGFPCFMDNLPVSNVSEDIISLRFNRIGQVEQVHNMKWSNPDKDVARKKAYLRTLMLHIYAEMFRMEKVPVTLRWSYPSAMNNQLLNKYQLIWDDLALLSPVSNAKGDKYKLNISKAQRNLTFDSHAPKPIQPMTGNPATTPSPSLSSPKETSQPVDTAELMANLKLCLQQQQTLTQMLGMPMPAELLANVQSQLQDLGQQITDITAKLASPQSAAPSSGFAAQPAQTAGFAQAQTAPSGFAAAPSGFQSQQGVTGFAEQTKPENQEKNELPDIAPDDPNRIVRYNPERLFRDATANNSLTEANAVANFISSSHANKDILTLCFDIGGSTTDISALYRLDKGITMIKQNSIRFAAQRVSGATRYVKEFENVLRSVCSRFNIDILGLNVGDNRFTPETASYYFDQIVDRLSEEQLPDFYRLILAEAPGLMWVNMYVTGLLMYYAGQISAKLIKDIERTDNSEIIGGQKYWPEINICFAGKGSRLMQWLAATQPDLANQYYMQMFQSGFGNGGYTENRIIIELPPMEKGADIKYEVSKGLAKNITELCNPAGDNETEIIGESGFSCVTRDNRILPLEPINSITPEMIEYIGTRFSPSAQTGDKFRDFCRVFHQTSRQLLNLDIPDDFFDKKASNLNITSYVQQMPEYIHAHREKSNNNGKFDFVAPIIILEGMNFYDNHLLKALK